jgi:hypothetical protein
MPAKYANIVALMTKTRLYRGKCGEFNARAPSPPELAKSHPSLTIYPWSLSAPYKENAENPAFILSTVSLHH